MGIVLGFALAGHGAIASELVFPGAEGFGAGAVGWRQGELRLVTTLEDSGPGSLRDCAENAGTPRICGFAVSGTIDLEGPIHVGSNIYIAGQTAPGDGVQLRITNGGHGPIILKNVSDVVIRHLKLRPGPSPEPSPTVDAITVENAQRVFLGNLSMAFATDETFNIHVSGATASDITLADSILAYSLDRSNHPEGRHSKGALICSDEGQGNRCGRITLLRNLFAHHRDRSPDVKATDIGPVEVINNVFYNSISQFGEFYDLLGNADIAYLGNLALAGKSTIQKTPEAVQVFEWTDGATVRLLASDNLAGVAKGCDRRNVQVLDRAAESALVAPPGWPVSVTPMPASEVLNAVLARAGDRIQGRRTADALDARVIKGVRNCRGKVINRVDQVGGWPVLAPADPAETRDSDNDGLPDLWEETRAALDSARADDVWAIDPQSGMSHVETWLALSASDGTWADVD
ncbi:MULTISPECIES: polysaccharide lyase family 1 protein [unclassified Roseivivax]|uniref:pectate lyase family protein n=1 Tax=unclassified Roseivivax TaxID=2639302 RepID=UPI001267FAB4|nr:MULTISPECIES: hypothetical protein [unclassified Roseivivax]